MIVRTDVLALMAEIGDGKITVEQAAPRLQRLLVPATVRISPVGDAMALLRAEYDDSLPPYTPDSWDDVRGACGWGLITRDQADTLADRVTIPPSHVAHGEPY